MMKVYIKYGFIFEPDETWPTLYQFDASFSKFLAGMGLEAELIKSQEGQEPIRLLYISKKETNSPDIKPIPPSNKSIKQMKESLLSKEGRGK